MRRIYETHAKYYPKRWKNEWTYVQPMEATLQMLLRVFPTEKVAYYAFETLMDRIPEIWNRDIVSKKLQNKIKSRFPDFPSKYVELTALETVSWIRSGISCCVHDHTGVQRNDSFQLKIWDLVFQTDFQVEYFYEFVLQALEVYAEQILGIKRGSGIFGPHAPIQITYDRLEEALEVVKGIVNLQTRKQEDPNGHCYVWGCPSKLASRKERWFGGGPIVDEMINESSSKEKSSCLKAMKNSIKQRKKRWKRYTKYKQRHHCKRCTRAVCDNHSKRGWQCDRTLPKWGWRCKNRKMCKGEITPSLG